MSSLSNSRRWRVVPADRTAEEDLAVALGISPLVARIMVARGIRDVDAARRFLTPSLDRDWGNPLDIPGMGEVADRVGLALDRGEEIAVFGDFDVDGITSTCLLTEALRALGGTVHPFIPNRFEEGYGLTQAALERVLGACSPDLVITVDNGIAARNEVGYLLDRGIDVVVTDHHEPADLVPQGIPVADPKLAEKSPSRELAGAGVALKLVQVLGERAGRPDLWREYTEVACLGTMSDMMSLTPENRALVSDGMARMRATSRAGYIALAAVTGTDLSCITADGLSFSLVPRLNAAGRMADPALALDLLLERDPVRAAALAQRLEEINRERRDIESRLTDEALSLVERSYKGGRVIVVGGEGWHEGVKGIVASRLVNRYHVPSLLFSIADGVARGSGRSVGSVNLFEAVEQCQDLLMRFGGHAGAVGVTLAAENLDAFRERMEEVLSSLPEERFEDTDEVAALVGLEELDTPTVEGLSVLEPYGQGNKAPLLGAVGVTMVDRARVGKTGDHLRFSATDGRSTVPAIMFRAPDIEYLVDCDSVVDLVFEAVAERWQGRVKTKLMVKDILVRTCDDGGSRAAAPLVDELFSQGGAPALAGPDSEEPSGCGAARCDFDGLSSGELTERLRQALIGDHGLHDAQREALDALSQGESCLAVMATGRGKSLVFQIHAAREAIAHGRASVFVYPLRALVADQAYHLARAYAKLGLSVELLTGETGGSERDAVFRGLAEGTVDVVLTTPEFLVIHAGRFADSRRIGFVAVDEAHHAARAKGGERPAYLRMPETLARLGHPLVLATTATADGASAREAARLLGIERIVIDDALRENLSIDDEREVSGRENRLVSIVSTGEKCVVYVNSRDQSVALARMLRCRVPELGGRIAFYNAGLDRGVRTKVEEAFRAGDLTCIVSTSAFGEGVNLPDIRHVVLYHMPFGPVEFNQMSGRAGRDGEPASIHLLYSSRDARINERVLAAAAPSREELVTLYRALQTMWRHHRSETGEQSFSASDMDIAGMCMAIDARTPVEERAVSCGIDVFRELGFMRTEGAGGARRIEMADNPGKVELERSTRYLEGIRARLSFEAFRDWALTADARDMLSRVNRPITPGVPDVPAAKGER